jgi:small subunit ribosomal protein S2
MRDRGDFASFTKKEALGMTRKIERLEMLLGGIRNMAKTPELLFVVDVRREDTSIHEANLLEIPVVAMVDTNCDPRNIDYIIPSNDDAIRAIKLVVGRIADAVLEGQAMRKDEEAEMPEGFMEYQPDTELSDEDLLGAATLAKLQTQRDEEAEEAEEAESGELEDVSEAETPVVDEAKLDEVEEETAEVDEEDDSEETEDVVEADEEETEEVEA